MGDFFGCAFTGHRALPTNELLQIRNLLDRAIAYAYTQGCRAFYAGGAIGFDTEAAERVIAFRETHRDIALILILPCHAQEAKWSDAQKKRYSKLLKCADVVRYTAEEYTPDCMRVRNEALVTAADMMIAYLSHFHSGAGQTVNMAKKKGIPVYNLYNKE